MNVEFSDYYNAHQSEFEGFHPGISSYLLFFYNTQSIQSAFHDVECDRIHQAAVNMRTVYEAIPKMYFLALYPEENEFVLVSEHIANMSLDKVQNELKGKECLKYLNGKELKFETKTQLQTFKSKYTPNTIRKKIYSQERHAKIQNLYSTFSGSAHPYILRNRTSTAYDPVDTELFFEFLESFSYFNIQAYLEGNYDFLVKIGIHQEINDFLNSQAHKFKTFYEDVYFFPDNKNLDRKLNSHIVTRTD